MPQPIVIGFNGEAGAGKDTCADYLVQAHGFVRLAFADALKQATLALDPLVCVAIPNSDESATEYYPRISAVIDDIGWDEAKHRVPEVRRLLQNMGTEVGRQILGENCWVDIVDRKIQVSSACFFVITDMRFPNEFEYVKNFDFGFTVRIERPDNPLAIPKTHASEQHQPPQADFKIINHNNAFDALHTSLDELAHDVVAEYTSVHG